MLLCSADMILGALNVIKLPDMLLFDFFFSQHRDGFRGKKLLLGDGQLRGCPKITQQHRATTPHPHHPQTLSQMCPLPAPVGAILSLEDTPTVIPTVPRKLVQCETGIHS